MLHLHDLHHVQVNGLIGFSDSQHSVYYSLFIDRKISYYHIKTSW